MIDIQNITFSYKKKTPLFEKFSLSIANGSIVGLLGKNGAGKTTLLKLIAGLLPTQSGTIQVNGFMPADRKPTFLADISFIPEEFSLPQLSISAYVAALRPLYPNFDNEKLNNILTEFELQHSDKLHKLSHGQRKKFLIASALSCNSKMLILDEPTNGLDIPSKSLFRKVLVSSVTNEQIVLISTHQVKDIDSIIDTVVVLDKGKTIFADTFENISRDYRFETVNDFQTAENALYFEKRFNGYPCISSANNDKETNVDIELLFNYLTTKKS
ncbi:MAG: ABC transporter ATP-binding protein [Dysgonamonadaceae bacterium]|jgi:ABC-2 type transport system ATP-binding protein|nr:ABC transporter ATP-binding protein [Dysgonamonadaceae bacterium]